MDEMGTKSEQTDKCEIQQVYDEGLIKRFNVLNDFSGKLSLLCGQCIVDMENHDTEQDVRNMVAILKHKEIIDEELKKIIEKLYPGSKEFYEKVTIE